MNITDELLVSYVEGTVSQREREAVRQYLVEHPDEMKAVIMQMDEGHHDSIHDIAVHSDEEYFDNLGNILDEIDSAATNCQHPEIKQIYLPMTAMAAQNNADNLCVIRCEGVALRHLGIDVTDDELLQRSQHEGWQTANGTALHNIGKLAGLYGMSVNHRYLCNIEDIKDALLAGATVIATVDGNELLGDYAREQENDRIIGLTPNHVVMVKEVSKDTVTIYDPATIPTPATVPGACPSVTYPLSQFLDAWNDSSNNLCIISNSKEYIPHPLDLSAIEMEEELEELREAIAENVHEVWAETRRKEGWTYGTVRDDARKQHPDMRPYNLLSDGEKEYDRITAMNTIKLVKALGWELRRKK